MGDEIRAGLVVDQSAFQAQLAGIDAKQIDIDRRNAATRARVEGLLTRLKIAEAKTVSLEAVTNRVIAKGARFAGKAVVAYAATEVLSELGIPEAARPLVNVGVAALAGASFGGAYGAAAFATLATMKELYREMKKEFERGERLKMEILQRQERQDNRLRDMIAEMWDRHKKLLETIAKEKEATRKEVQDWVSEGARALYQPGY
jgi:hypothetical protein